MSSSTASWGRQIRRGLRALRQGCCAGRRHGIALVIAVLLALLNPMLCVLHCLMLPGTIAHGMPVTSYMVQHSSHGHAKDHQGGPEAHRHRHSHATTPAGTHAHQGSATLAVTPGPGGLCGHHQGGIHGADQLPRAVYELATGIVLLLFIGLILLGQGRPAVPGWVPTLATAPLTPPPRPASFI